MSGSAFDAVVSFLEGDGWPVAIREDGQAVLATKYQGQAGTWFCEGRIDLHDRFVFYSISPVSVPETRRVAAAEYVTRANWGIAIGNFELDFDGGAVRVKTSVDVEDAELTSALVRNLVYANVRTMDRYAPGLVAVIDEGLAPAEAIARAEEE